MKARIEAVAIPDFTKGKAMVEKTRTLEQPSMRAASSSSKGSSSKKPHHYPDNEG